MVAIVAGNGVGLFNASLNTLGGSGVLGQGILGQARGRSYVNAATGNLILQMQDELLSGRGMDLQHVRTYNSQGLLNDGDADGWRWDGERKVLLSGAIGAAGSTVTRTDGDGHETIYAWSAAASRYVSAEGSGAHDTLTYDSGAQQWTWTDGSTRLVEKYAAGTGRLVSQQDTSGNTVTYGYDASGRLASVTDSGSGQKLVSIYATVPGTNHIRLQRVDTYSLTVNANGQATGTLGAAVKQVEYGYDTAGRLISVTTDLTPANVTDSAVYVTTYTYDGASTRIASVAQSDGSSASFTYDTSNRIRTVTDANGTQTFTYDATANRTDISIDVGDGTPKVWSYFYDSARRLTEIRSPAAAGANLSTRFQYDADGNLTQFTDARNNAVVYQYDAQGNRTLERDAQGNTVARTYDGANQLLTETRYKIPDPDGAGIQSAGDPLTTRFVYDAQSRLRFAVSAEGRVSENRYGTSTNGYGLLTHSVRYAGGLYDVSALAPSTALTETQLAAWVTAQDKTQVEQTEYLYDFRGNLSKRTEFSTIDASGVGVLDAAATVTEHIYDGHGALLQTIAVRGSTRDQRTTLTSAVYDGLGRELQLIDSNGTRTQVYDDANRRIQVTTGTGLVQISSFDNRGRLVSVNQSDGSVSSTAFYIYDAAGRLRMVEDAQGGRRYSFYDAAGRVQYQVDSAGAVTGYEYNANGQVTTETQYLNRAVTSSWYNTATQQVTKASLTVGASGSDVVANANHDRATRYGYDNAGRLTTRTGPGNVVTHTLYDGLSRVTTEQTGERITRYIHDRDGHQVGVVDPLGYLTENKLDAAGRLIETVRYSTRSPAAENVAAPVWIGVTNQSATGGRPFEYRLPAYDADGDVLSFSIVGTLPSWLSFDATSATLKGTPPNALSSYDVTVRASDGRGKSSDVTVRITTVNSAPIWGELPDTTMSTIARVFNLVLPAATDNESSTLTYAMRSTLPAGLTFDPTQRAIVGVPTTPGMHTVTVRVSDAQGLYVDRSFTLTVTGFMTWTAVPVQELRSNQLFSLKVPEAQSSPDGTFFYSKVSGPAWLSFDPNTRELSGTPPVTLSFETVVLQAQDSGGTKVLLSFGLNVQSNAPTWQQLPPAIVAVGGAANYLPPAAADPEGQTLTYSVVGGLPPGLVIDSATGRITGTTGAVGFYSVILRATDPHGMSVGNTLSLQVRAAAPTATSAGSDILSAWRPANLDGLRTHQYYDGQGRLTGSVNERGFLSENVYDDHANAQSSLRYLDAVTVASNDTLATLRTKAGVAKQTTTVEYDRFGRVLRNIDVDGTVTRNEYDSAGRLVREIRADGTAEQRANRTRYNAFGEVTGTLDGVGDATLGADPTQTAINAAIAAHGVRYEYDSLGRRIKVIDANNNATFLYYDREGRLTHTVNARGEVSETVYSRFGQAEKVRHYGNRFTGAALASLSGGFATAGFLAQVAALADANKDQLTTYEYDQRGLAVKQVDAEGFVTTQSYTAHGELVAQMRAIAQNKTVTTQFDYDLRGRLLSQTEDVSGINFSARTAYDAFGRVIQSVDAAGRATTTSYSDSGRTIEVTDALNRMTRSEHDAFGRVLKQTDASGQQTTFTYDDVARSVRVTTPEGIQVTTTRTRHAETLNVVDGRGNTKSYEYDAAGRLTKITDALGQVISSNTYDNSGRLGSTTDARGLITTVSYDAANRVIERRVDPSGLNLRTTYEFDALGRQIKVTEGAGTSAAHVTGYQYDRKGQLIQVIVDPDGLQLSTRYTFDGLGNTVRVERGTVSKPTQQVTLYVFDKLGRRVKEIVAPSAVFGPGPVRSRDITTEYRYDAAGNVSRTINANGHSTWYIYDAAGRRTHAINAEGEVSQSTYDANGRVVQTRRYFNRLNAATVAGFGDVVSTITLATHANDQRSYSVYDADGRERFTVTASVSTSWAIVENRFDANGNVIETRRYDKYLPEGRLNAIDAAASPGITVAELLAELTTLGYSEVDSTLAKTQRTRFAYDANNRLRFTVDGLGSVSETVYDSTGNVVAKIKYATRPTLPDYTESAIDAAVNRSDARNQVTRFAYDVAGRLRYTIQLLASGGQGAVAQHIVTEQTYDALGRVILNTAYATAVGALADYSAATLAGAVTASAQDHRTAYVFDTAGRHVYTVEVLKINAQGVATQHLVSKQVHDALGQVVQTTKYASLFALANYSKATVDAAVNASPPWQDRTTSMVYDAAGRKRFMIAPDGALSEIVYDALGQVTEKRELGLLVDAGTPRTEAALSALRGNRGVLDKFTRGEKYTYDRAGRVLTATDARGFIETNEYNALGDRTGYTDKNGAKWTYIYDRRGELYRQLAPAVLMQLSNEVTPASRSLETRFYRDAFGHLVKQVEALGTVDARTTDYVYDRLGRLTTTLLPGFYDPATGKMESASATGRFRRDIETTYDTLGNAVRTRTRTGANTYIYGYKTYDLLGRVVHDVDVLNNVTAFTYTSFGEQKTVTRHGIMVTGTPASSGYWTASEIAAKVATDTRARTITTTYDNVGRKTQVTKPAVDSYFFSSAAPGMNAATVTAVSGAAATRYEYNAFGEVHRESVKVDDSIFGGEWKDTWHYYDQMGRETRTIDARAHHTTRAYDAFGNLIQVIEYAESGMSGSSGDFDEPGTNDSDQDRITGFTYDALNRQISIQRYGLRYTSWNGSSYVQVNNALEMATTVQSTTYDKLGKVLSQTDGLGNITSFEYNALGQLIELTEPARSTAQAGMVNPFTNQVTVSPVTTMTLDGFGNIVKRERNVGSGAGDTLITLQSFDAAGNAISSTDAMGNVKYRQYDYAGRVTRETQAINVDLGALGTNSHALERRYAYDATGRQTHVLDIYTDGTQTLQTGKRSVFDGFGEVIEEHKVWGTIAMAPESLFWVRTASYNYDNAGNLVTKLAGDGMTQYYYNLDGKVTRQEQRGNNNAFDGTPTRITETYYDDLGRAKIQRLPAFTANVGAATAFTEQEYDRWGNVVRRTQGSFLSTTSEAIQRTTVTYEYNADNQVIAERLPGMTAWKANGTSYGVLVSHELSYDLLGRAVQERDVADNWGTTAVEANLLRARSKLYNSVGQLLVETDASNVSKHYAYDAHGRKVVTVNAGVVFVDTLDKNGNILSHGVLRSGVVVPLSHYKYDQANRRFASADIANASAEVPWTYTRHDERNLVRTTRDADGVTMTYNYDYFGNKILEQDALGNSRTWFYSADFFGGTHDAGRLLSTSAGGRGTTYQYNDFGQVSQETYSGTGNDRTYTYHENGLVKDIVDHSYFGTPGPVGGADFSTFNDVTHYEYTVKGLVAKETFNRTGSQEVQAIASPDTFVTTTIAPIVRTTYTTYDALGRMATVTAPHAENSGDWINSLNYGYDELGNVRKVIANFHHAGESADEISERWFAYDAEGRMTVADGQLVPANPAFPTTGQVTVGAGKTGTRITYDSHGRRRYEERFVGSGQKGKLGSQIRWDTFRTTQYSYNDLGHQQTTWQQINNVITWTNSGPAPDLVPDEFGQQYLLETRQTDLRGNVTNKTTYEALGPNDITNVPAVKTETTTFYRADGKVSVQRIKDRTVSGASPKDVLIEYTYDSAGILRLHEYHQGLGTGSAQTDEFAYEYSMEQGGLEEKSVTATHFQSGVTRPPGVTTNYYDSRGQLQRQTINNGTTFRTRNFSYDAQSRIIAQREGTGTLPQSQTGVQNYYYANGRQVGTLGSGSLLAEQFSFAYTPISDSYPAASPGAYAVNAGDTLASIAYAVFGDRSLWYLIADANSVGIGPDAALPAEEVGKIYRIPNVVSNVHNNASTFRPYNSANIIGDSTPMPGLPRPPSDECSSTTKVLAAVIVTAVAVAVTVYTGGLAGAALGGGVLGSIIGAGVGAAAGNAAGQLVGMGLGQQDGFNSGQVFTAGFTGAFAGAAGSVTNGLTGLTKGFADVAQSYISTQVGNAMEGRDTDVWSPLIDMGTKYAISGTLGKAFKDLDAPRLGSALQQIAAGALNPRSGWVFNDRSRDWANIASQAAGAFTRVALSGGGSGKGAIIDDESRPKDPLMALLEQGDREDSAAFYADQIKASGDMRALEQGKAESLRDPGRVLLADARTTAGGDLSDVANDMRAFDYVLYDKNDNVIQGLEPCYVTGQKPCIDLDENGKAVVLVRGETIEIHEELAETRLAREQAREQAQVDSYLKMLRGWVEADERVKNSRLRYQYGNEDIQKQVDARMAPITVMLQRQLMANANARANAARPIVLGSGITVDRPVFSPYPPNFPAERAVPFGREGGMNYDELSVRTSTADAYMYDGLATTAQITDDVDRLARAGYKEIHVLGAGHGDALGATQGDVTLQQRFIDISTNAEARHRGLRVYIYDLGNPADMIDFVYTQRRTALGQLPQTATLAAHCFSLNCVAPSSPALMTPTETVPRKGPAYGSVREIDGVNETEVTYRDSTAAARKTNMALGGLDVGMGFLSIYGATHENNPALATLGYAGGTTQVVGGATTIYGAARSSTSLLSAGSKVSLVGNILMAPVTLSSARDDLKSGDPGRQVIGVEKAVGVVWLPAAILGVYTEVVVKPAAETFYERTQRGLMELNIAPAGWRW